MELNLNRPTIGLALSGTGSRLIFYVGFLEELTKHKIPIDYIAASSSGAIVAAAFACGTMNKLKEVLYSRQISRDNWRKYFKRGKGGLYSLEEIEEMGRKLITKGLMFEDVKPLMSFVAADIENGKQVVLCMGDIARAGRISCTLPLIFEPVRWGGRTLMDGGLLNFIPVDVVREAGIDITIGINMRGTRHLFTTGQINIKKVFNLMKKAFLIDYLEKVWDWILPKEDEEVDFETLPGMFETLGKSMDLAIKASKKDDGQNLICDLMITPETTQFKFKNFDKSNKELYEYGVLVAQQNIPKIKELIMQKQAVVEKAI